MDPKAEGVGPFGPQSAVVEAMFERAARLSEAEADAIWSAHMREKAREHQFRAALEAVVDAAHVNGRSTEIKVAEQAGRDAVTVYRGTSLGDAVAGYVARLAEALVIADLVDAASVAPLTQPWLEVVGPFDASLS